MVCRVPTVPTVPTGKCTPRVRPGAYTPVRVVRAYVHHESIIEIVGTVGTGSAT